tara:strand:- start:2247 stop:2477 length:231 start_codon:yes stop_codon:yes gene_type:complete
MKSNHIFLLLVFCLVCLSSFFLLRINQELINFDLLFLEIETSKGRITLIAFFSGLLFALLSEFLYFLLKKNRKQEN